MGEKQLPAGSRGRTAAWNRDNKRTSLDTHMQALDTKARAEIKTMANRASSLQPREKGDLSARGQRDMQLLIRDALKGTVLNMLSFISTQGSAPLHPLSHMNLMPLHRWMDRSWLPAMPARIDLFLLNMHTHIPDPSWQEPVQFFGFLQTTSAHPRQSTEGPRENGMARSPGSEVNKMGCSAAFQTVI